MDATAGRRLERFVRQRWAEVGAGGIRGLCREAGITPEALYGWFRGENDPKLGHLADLARALKTTRSELVAAMDRDARDTPGSVPGPEPLIQRIRDRRNDRRPRWLRVLREARGLTPGQLASRIGKPTRDVQAWEAGRRQPTYQEMGALARELEVEFRDLFDPPELEEEAVQPERERRRRTA